MGLSDCVGEGAESTPIDGQPQGGPFLEIERDRILEQRQYVRQLAGHAVQFCQGGCGTRGSDHIAELLLAR